MKSEFTDFLVISVGSLYCWVSERVMGSLVILCYSLHKHYIGSKQLGVLIWGMFCGLRLGAEDDHGMLM